MFGSILIQLSLSLRYIYQKNEISDAP